MSILDDFLRDYLDEAELTIKENLPELPAFDPMELSGSETYATETYAIGGDRLQIEFYADVEYNEGFYAFIPCHVPFSVELSDGETFGGMGGFRIYLSREE